MGPVEGMGECNRGEGGGKGETADGQTDWRTDARVAGPSDQPTIQPSDETQVCDRNLRSARPRLHLSAGGVTTVVTSTMKTTVE